MTSPCNMWSQARKTGSQTKKKGRLQGHDWDSWGNVSTSCGPHGPTLRTVTEEKSLLEDTEIFTQRGDMSMHYFQWFRS